MTRSRKKLSATARLLKVELEKFDAVGGNGEFHRLEAEPAGEAGQLIVDQAKHQIAAVAEIERRGCAVSVALPAAIGGVVGPHDCCAEHHVARPQEGAGDIVRAIDQGRGIGLVREGGREGVSRLARIDESLTRASALCDGVRRRGAADLRDGRRLDLDEGIAVRAADWACPLDPTAVDCA